MADRDQLDGGNVSFLSGFARTLLVGAGAVAGLGSALWLNIVGSFAGLAAASAACVLANTLAVVLVAVLAMLITAAGSLIAADWRADVASRHARAGIDAAEFGLPAQRAAPSQINPSYVVTALSEGLQSILRAHGIASPSPELNVSVRTPVVVSTTGILVDPGPLVPSIAASKAVPNLVRNIQTPATSGAAMACATGKNAANASLGRVALAASRSAGLQMFRADSAASSVRLVANGGTWSDGFVCDWRVLPPDGHGADIVILSGDRGHRDQCGFLGVSSRDGAVDSELPGCRGPPTAGRRQTHATKTVPNRRSADATVCDNFGDQVPVCAAELHVIETYLDQVLRGLLASGSREPDGDRS
jgi:hypothetical protein